MGRSVFVVFALALAVGSPVGAAQQPVLYRMDKSHNVVRVALDVHGRSLGKGVRLTSKGGYDLFSVSPDGSHVVGFTKVKQCYDAEVTKSFWVTWRLFVERIGKGGYRKVIGNLDPVMQKPTIVWSPKGRYFQLLTGGFDLQVTVYSLHPVKTVLTTDCPLAISSDDRYGLGYVGGGVDYGVIDLKSGEKAAAADEGTDGAWVSGTHKIRWRDFSNHKCVGVVTRASGRLVVSR